MFPTRRRTTLFSSTSVYSGRLSPFAGRDGTGGGFAVVSAGPFPADTRYIGPDYNPWGWSEMRAWDWSPAWNTTPTINDANGRLLMAISGAAMP